MDLHITHQTCYAYTPAVEMAQHVAYLRPLETPWQTVRSHRLEIHPEPAQCNETIDVYGNHRCFFSLLAPHPELCVTAHSLVSTRAPQPARSDIAWETLRDRFRYHAGAPWDPAAEFSFASPRAPRAEAFAAYARPSFPPGVTALDGARDLMQRIHTDFRYETASTEVHTTALQALEQRAGVCQDFAHIMLACLRSLGLPARYVSGYLLTQPPPGQPRLVGSDASHAWIAIHLPDLPGAAQDHRWYDLDPTNVREGWGTPGEDYVTLATGRDYADISPMRGVIHGGSSHTLEVAVTVAPAGEAAPASMPA